MLQLHLLLRQQPALGAFHGSLRYAAAASPVPLPPSQLAEPHLARLFPFPPAPELEWSGSAAPKGGPPRTTYWARQHRALTCAELLSLELLQRQC